CRSSIHLCRATIYDTGRGSSVAEGNKRGLIGAPSASALTPGGCHTTSSKLNSLLASTAKSLFFCGRARKRNSGFAVPPTGGSKINRVGGNERMLVPLS